MRYGSVDGWGIPVLESQVSDRSEEAPVSVASNSDLGLPKLLTPDYLVSIEPQEAAIQPMLHLGVECAMVEGVWEKRGKKLSESLSSPSGQMPPFESGQKTCSNYSKRSPISSQMIPLSLQESKMSLKGSLTVVNKSQLQHLPEADRLVFEAWLNDPKPNLIEQIVAEPDRIMGLERWIVRLKFKGGSEFRGLGFLTITENFSIFSLIQVISRKDVDYEKIKQTRSLEDSLCKSGILIASDSVDGWGIPVLESQGSNSDLSVTSNSERLLVDSVAGELFHLSPNKFSQFKQQQAKFHHLGFDVGFHFGTEAQAEHRASQLVERGLIQAGDTVYLYRVRLKVSKPIHIAENRIGSFSASDVVVAIMDKAEKEGVPGVTDEMIDARYRDELMLGDFNLFDISYESPESQLKLVQDFLKRIGHDSVSYENSFEGGGVSYAVFDPALIEILGVEEVEIGNSLGESVTSNRSESLVDSNLSPEVASLFVGIADLQRDKPESAMLDIQRFHSGVLSFVVEHVGDIIHRMNEKLDRGDFGLSLGRDYVRNKAEKSLNVLENDFEKEHQQNMQRNADRQGVSLEEYSSRVEELLRAYGEAHAKLPVYNDLQWMARQACIELGGQEFEKAANHLKELVKISSSESLYRQMVTSYRGKPFGESLDQWGMPLNEGLSGDSTSRVYLESSSSQGVVESGILEAEWASSSSSYLRHKKRLIEASSRVLRRSESGSLPSMEKSITESSMPQFKAILILTAAHLKSQIHAFFQQANHKEYELYRNWVDAPNQAYLTQRKPWAENKGLVRLSIAGKVRILFRARMQDEVLYLENFVVFDDHDYDQAESSLKESFRPFGESLDRWGMPLEEAGQVFEYAPMYRSAGEYVSHPLVKSVFLFSRQMSGYPHGLVQVSREMSLDELEELQWSNLSSPEILSDALHDLLANEYIEAYREDPDAASFVIEAILNKFHLNLSQPREVVRQFLRNELLKAAQTEGVYLNERAILNEMRLNEIRWVMPSDSELESEFREHEIYDLLFGAGYPSAEEQAEGFLFFKNNLKPEEIDPKDLDSSNDWRFRFQDYASMRERVTSYGGPKDPDSMIKKIQSGGGLPMPVVVRKANGGLLLAGGATRTAIALLSDQKIKALVFDEKKAVQRTLEKYKNKIKTHIEKSRLPEIKEIARRVEAESQEPGWKTSGSWLDEIGAQFGDKAKFQAHTLGVYWGIIRRIEREIP